MKITKELIDRLNYPDDISKREYDDILSAIDKRVQDIWIKILSLSKRRFNWWAFSNDSDYDSGDGSDGGYFDPKDYKEWIDIVGDYAKICNDYYKYEKATSYSRRTY